jgi:hypothetical protein
MRLYVIIPSLFASLIFAFSAVAGDVAGAPPEIPSYVASLPPNTWVFAKLLWQGREPCTPDICEAGFYSPPLRLRVRAEKDSNDEGHSIEIVADIEGCESIVSNLIWDQDIMSLNSKQRYEYLASRVVSAVEKIEETCKTGSVEPVPTDTLRRFFRAPSALANDR